jgi:UDP-2,4-diacetamido-2,4,6-trideoxy-beta-L-altropyranose hydrolase
MRLRARPAKEDDLTLIFNWINDPLVRSMSFNQAPIALEAYKEEFEKILSQQNTHLLIIERYEESGNWTPIAKVQVDKDGQITMSIASEFRGQQLAESVLKTGMAYVRRDFSIKKLVARIKQNNIASIKAFEGAGFKFVHETKVKGNPCIEYTYRIPRREFGLFY